MAWHQSCNKPLREAMVTQLTDINTSMGINELTQFDLFFFPDGVLLHTWYSLVAYLKNVLESSSKKEGMDVLGVLVRCLQNIVSTQAVDPDKILVSMLTMGAFKLLWCWICFKETWKYISIFCYFSIFPDKRRGPVYLTVDIMAADDLEMQRARALAAMILT